LDAREQNAGQASREYQVQQDQQRGNFGIAPHPFGHSLENTDLPGMNRFVPKPALQVLR
jgi:hypothetical protein